MQTTHAWSWEIMKRKKKIKSAKGEWREKERPSSPDFTRKAQKCNKRLMYKTKGVEPNPRVERNKSTSKTLKVLTQYNP